jgi:hypothetical protein
MHRRTSDNKFTAKIMWIFPSICDWKSHLLLCPTENSTRNVNVPQFLLYLWIRRGQRLPLLWNGVRERRGDDDPFPAARSPHVGNRFNFVEIAVWNPLSPVLTVSSPVLVCVCPQNALLPHGFYHVTIKLLSLSCPCKRSTTFGSRRE